MTITINFLSTGRWWCTVRLPQKVCARTIRKTAKTERKLSYRPKVQRKFFQKYLFATSNFLEPKNSYFSMIKTHFCMVDEVKRQRCMTALPASNKPWLDIGKALAWPLPSVTTIVETFEYLRQNRHFDSYSFHVNFSAFSSVPFYSVCQPFLFDLCLVFCRDHLRTAFRRKTSDVTKRQLQFKRDAPTSCCTLIVV